NLSNGNVAPSLVLRNRDVGVHAPTDVAVGPNGKIYVANTTQGGGGSITVYPAYSNVDVNPIATIVGPSTGITFASGVATDSAGKIYVCNSNALLVFNAGSNGDVAPAAKISGPDS